MSAGPSGNPAALAVATVAFGARLEPAGFFRRSPIPYRGRRIAA